MKTIAFCCALIVACGGSDHGPIKVETADQSPEVELLIEPTDVGIAADVVAVEVSGSEGSYSFSVTVCSRETGCDQYADWWEVVSDEGELLYRRVLCTAMSASSLLRAAADRWRSRRIRRCGCGRI